MCNGVIFKKITKNGIFHQYSHIIGSLMALRGGGIFKKKSTPITLAHVTQARDARVIAKKFGGCYAIKTMTFLAFPLLKVLKIP